MCNGCKTGTPGVRGICVTCRPGPMRPGGFVDFCNSCVEALKDINHPNHKKVIEGASDEDH